MADKGAVRTCIGGTHVIPVPRGMTAEESWAEIVTLGRLAVSDALCSWSVVECSGGPECECLAIDLAPSYRLLHNDIEVPHGR